MKVAYITIEIENPTGEPIDVERLNAAITAAGYKPRTWAPGAHTLPKAVIRRLLDDLDIARHLLAGCIEEAG